MLEKLRDLPAGIAEVKRFTYESLDAAVARASGRAASPASIGTAQARS